MTATAKKAPSSAMPSEGASAPVCSLALTGNQNVDLAMRLDRFRKSGADPVMVAHILRDADALAALVLLTPPWQRWREAEVSYREALARKPRLAQLDCALGEVLAATGRIGEAVPHAEKALAQTPLVARRHYDLALMYWYAGRLHDADRVIRKATDLWPRDISIWFGRLYQQMYGGNVGGALAMLTDRINWPPSVPESDFALVELVARAMESNQPAERKKALDANMTAARNGLGYARNTVIFDTAGRLHTKHNLMEELKKIHRILGRRDQTSPHEVLLVCDATTGSNALQQAREGQVFTQHAKRQGFVPVLHFGLAAHGLPKSIVFVRVGIDGLAQSTMNSQVSLFVALQPQRFDHDCLGPLHVADQHRIVVNAIQLHCRSRFPCRLYAGSSKHKRSLKQAWGCGDYSTLPEQLSIEAHMWTDK